MVTAREDVILVGTDMSGVRGCRSGRVRHGAVPAERRRLHRLVRQHVGLQRPHADPAVHAGRRRWPVPPKFNYTLITFAGDGTQDVQHGSVDLAKEIVPD